MRILNNHLMSMFNSKAPVEISSIGNNACLTREEMKMIDFEDETREFEDRLIGGWKQLQVIPIVGMSGLVLGVENAEDVRE